MDGTRELVDAAQVGAALAWLSAGALVLAPLALCFAGGRAGLRRIGLVAALGVLIWPLWVVYNRIEDHFGLDSVAALLINMALFAAVGIGAGFLLRRVWPEGENAAPPDGQTENE